MTLEQLEKEQQNEIRHYWDCRAERLVFLERDQKEIMDHTIIGNDRTNTLLKELLAEQQKAWEEMEKDDLDMLTHIHQLEKEALLDNEARQEKLNALLSPPAKPNDRGR